MYRESDASVAISLSVREMQENPLASPYRVLLIKVFAKHRLRRPLRGGMHLTPARVEREYEWVRDRGDVVVPLVNEVRADLGERFGVVVDPIEHADYCAAVDATFADGDRAVNVAALVALLRELDVEGDYPGFVVDELLGRELAATISGEQPLRTLGEATFHYADLCHHGDADEPAGVDDCEAALAAGVQELLPGWDWTERESPFTVAAAARRHEG